ncbi:MAG: acyltransferase [Pseudomonadota bacterium]
MRSDQNRFDLLRLVFATGVFVYHAVALAALDVGGVWEARLGQLAELCIQGFFIVSGALVYGSWERSRGLSDYAGKRVRRLYPAYLVVILLPAFVSLSLTGDVFGTGRYLAANGVFLNFLAPDLPGLFENNRFSEVNGALWTLKIEVMFYIALPVIAWVLVKFRSLWWLGLLALYCGGVIWAMFVPEIVTGGLGERLARQLPGQMAYFASGMAIWKLWDVLRQRAVLCLIVGILVLVGAFLVPFVESVRAIGLALLVAGMAFMPGPHLNAARWGDVSYGVYIVHFPILQALVAFGVFASLGTVSAIAIAFGLVFGLSFALWWLVEKPALRADSHYRRASERK